MAGNQFLTEIDLEFHGNFDEIAAQAQAALDKIARSAGEAEASGGSVRGLGPAVQEVGRRATSAVGAIGPEEVRSLQRIFADFQNGLRQNVPRYTGQNVDVQRQVDQARQRAQESERRASAQQSRDSERLLAVQRQKDSEKQASDRRANQQRPVVQPVPEKPKETVVPKAPERVIVPAPVVGERTTTAPAVAEGVSKEDQLKGLTEFAKQHSFDLPVRVSGPTSGTSEKPTETTPVSRPASSNVAQETKRLEDLHGRGKISDAELEARKTELQRTSAPEVVQEQPKAGEVKIPEPKVIKPKLEPVEIIPPVVTEKQHSPLEPQVIPKPEVKVPKLDPVEVIPPVVTEKQHSPLEPEVIPAPKVTQEPTRSPGVTQKVAELDQLIAKKTALASVEKELHAGKPAEKTPELATGGAGKPPIPPKPPAPPTPASGGDEGRDADRAADAVRAAAANAARQFSSIADILNRFGLSLSDLTEEERNNLSSFAQQETASRKKNAVGSYLLSSSPDYLTADTRAQTEAAILNAKKTQSLNNQGTIGAFVNQDTQSKNLGAEFDKARAGSEAYQQSIIEAATQANALAAELDSTKAGNEAYRTSIIRAAEEANVLAAIMSEAKATNDDYNTSMVLAATGAKQEAAALDAAKAGDDDYLTATGAAATAKKQLAASEELATQENDQYIAAVRDTIAATKQRAAIEAEAAGSKQNVENDARTEVARQRQKRNTSAQVNALTTPQDLQNQGAAQAADARQKLAVQYAALAARTGEDVQTEAKLIDLKKRQAAKLAKAVDQVQGNNATLFQTLRHSFRGGSGGEGGGGSRTASSEQTFGQFVGQHVTNTLGYAIPGIAIGIGFTELERSVKEAEQAQRDIAEVRAEFEALGQSDQFSGFANSIKTVSNSTGLAVTEVAELALAMKGVFGDTNQATIALQGIATAAVAMDIGLKEAQTDIIGIDQAFTSLASQNGSGITQISNEILHLQDVTGVAAKYLTPGVADVASSANQVGLSFNQTASTVAAASQRSGLDPSVIGQTFSKLIDGVSQNLQEIFSVYAQIPQLAGKLPKLEAEAPAQQIPQILQDYTKLNPGEQIAIQRTLGINASAVPALNALTQSGQKAAAIGATTAPANRTQEEFNKQIDTLQGHIQRLQQSAANFGVALINGGVGKFFSGAADAAGGLLHVLTDINRTIPGIGSAFLIAGGALATWGIGSKIISSLISLIKGLFGATVTTTGAITAETAAEGANAIAAGVDAAATGALATAEGAAAGAGALNAGERVLGSGLILPSGVGGVTGEAGAATAGRGLFGIEALGAGAGAGGLGSIGPAVTASSAVPSALIAGIAGFAAFAGTTKLLDLIPGSKGGHAFGLGYHPTTSLTSDESDFIKNNPDRIAAVGATGTPQQAAQLQADAKKKDTLDFYKLYNQLTSTPAGKIAQTAPTTDLADLGSAADVNAEKNHGTLEEILAAQKARNDQVNLLAKQAQVELTDWAGLQTGYQAGSVAFATLLTAATANVSQAQAAYDAQKTGGTQAQYEALQTAIQQRNAILDQQAQQAQQFFASTQQQGNPQADVAIIRSLAVEKQLSPQGKLTQVQGIVQAYQQELQDEANLALSTADRNKILEQGIQVSAANLAVINKGLAANGLPTLKSLTIPGQQVTPLQTFQASQEGIQAQEAISTATAFEDPVKVAQAQIASAVQQQKAYLAAGGSTDKPQFQQLVAQVKTGSNQLIDANNAIVSAQISLTKAYDTASGNVVGQAQDDQRAAEQAFTAAHGTAEKLAAQAQLVAANREVEVAVASISTAQVNLAKAYNTANGNAVAQAQDDQQLAEIAFNVARGPVDKLNAQAQLVAANREVEVAIAAVSTAQVNLAKAYNTANGNVVAQAQNDQQLAIVAYNVARGPVDKMNAEAQLVAANREVEEAIAQVSTARLTLAKAYDTAGGNELAEAQADQQIAAVALSVARGSVAKLQAEAQKVAADREVVTAINDIATAQAGLLTAMANATGDPAQIIAAANHAAAVDLSNANRIKAADQAIGKNPNNDAAYVSALTQYYNDRATAADTVAQQTISETETLLFLGKETATQAIAQLEAALPGVKGNVQATNQILTEIRQIQNSAGGDLSFDLPTTLLPSTLYQARRLEAGTGNILGSPATGAASVTVNINVNGGSPSAVASAVNKLTAVVAGPQRSGTTGPLLNG